MQMQKDYAEAAAAYDKEYQDWLVKDLGLERAHMHPCHMQLAVAEGMSVLT